MEESLDDDDNDKDDIISYEDKYLGGSQTLPKICGTL